YYVRKSINADAPLRRRIAAWCLSNTGPRGCGRGTAEPPSVRFAAGRPPLARDPLADRGELRGRRLVVRDEDQDAQRRIALRHVRRVLERHSAVHRVECDRLGTPDDLGTVPELAENRAAGVELPDQLVERGVGGGLT